MKIKFRDNDCTECWDGVFYKKLSDYPNITEWELQTVADFIAYEENNGRDCELEGDEKILSAVRAYLADSSPRKRLHAPDKITECIACPKYKGCLTDFVCHTTSVKNAVEILKCGSLLSPVKVRGIPAAELAKESRNAANDPEDYFDYVMFAWGNCQSGDRLVMERKLGRFPDELDLSIGFTPGVRFFFKYDKLLCHPNTVFDGVLPLKIRDEVVLKDWCYAIIIPDAERENFADVIPDKLSCKVHFIENDCRDIWQWTEKVYEFVKQIDGELND